MGQDGASNAALTRQFNDAFQKCRDVRIRLSITLRYADSAAQPGDGCQYAGSFTGFTFPAEPEKPVETLIATLPPPVVPEALPDARPEANEIVSNAPREVGEEAQKAPAYFEGKALPLDLRLQGAFSEALSNTLHAAVLDMSFVKGVAIGLFYDGLYSTVADAATVTYTMATLKGRVIQFGIDAAWNWWSGTWEKSQAHQLKEQATVVAQKVETISKEVFGFIEDHPKEIGALLISGTVIGWGPTASLASMTDEGQAVLMIAGARLKKLYDDLAAQINAMPPEEQAEVVGRIVGFVLYQVVETYVTAGAGKAVKAGTLGAKLDKIIDGIPLLRRFNKSQEITKAVVGVVDDVVFALRSLSCFVAGTPIHTLEGLKPIEEIRPGDMVLTRSERSGTKDVRPVYKPVIQRFITHPNALYQIELSADDGSLDTLTTTGNHPFYVDERGGFVDASELRPGDRLVLPEGRNAQVRIVREEHGAPGKSFTTYNFAVAETHTYFVGESGVWVHNSSSQPCSFLAKLLYTETKVLGTSDAEAVAKAARIAEDMLNNGTILNRFELDRHLHDAVKAAQLASKPPIPRSSIAYKVLEASESSFDKHKSKLYGDLKNHFDLDVPFRQKDPDLKRLLTLEYEKLLNNGTLKYLGFAKDLNGDFYVYEFKETLYLFDKSGTLVSRFAGGSQGRGADRIRRLIQ